MDEVIFVLAFSIIFQLAAAFLALRLIKLTGRRTAWVLIAAALALMALRRCITLLILLSGDSSRPLDLFAEVVALATSILLFAGVAWIAPLFLSIRNSQDGLRKAHDELSKANEALRVEIKERKRAEEALRESEHRYRELFENAYDVIFTIDLNGFITSVNEAGTRLTGYTREELLGMNISRVLPPEELQRATDRIRKVTMGEQLPSQLEYEIIKKDGSRAILEVSFRPILKDEKITGFHCIARDITEKKEMEMEIIESHHFLNSVISNSPDAIIALDAKGKILLFNTGAEKIFGYRREELIGKNIVEDGKARFYGEVEIARRIMQAMRESIDGKVANFEVHGKTKDGRDIYLSVSASLLKNEKGEVIGNLGLVRDITLRKQMEEELRASEEKYRSLVESTEDCIYVVDRDGRYLLANNRYLSHLSSLSLPSDKLIGRTYGEFHTPEETKEFAEKVNAVFETAKSLSFEYRSRRDGGYFLRTLSPIVIDGKVKSVTSISKNITGRKQAEEALRETNEKLHALIRASPLAIITLDPDGNIKSWNPAAEQIFGWREQEVLNRPSPIVPEDKKDEYRTLSKRVLRGEPFSGVEVCRQRKDGSLIDLSLSTAPLHDAKGNIIGITALFADITERKWMEREIRSSEEKYRSLVESTEDLIYSVDRDCRYLFVNNKLLSRFGLSIDQVIGGTYSEFHSPEESKEFAEKVNQVFETGESVHQEHRSRRDNRYFFRTLSPVKEPDGRVTAVTVVSKDITERKQMEWEILEAKEDAELYLDIMSHDINNLNQIGLGYLELLLDSEELDEVQRKYTAKALNSVRGSIRLIGDVRLLQQVKGPSEFRDIDLNEVISEVVNEFSTNPYKKVDFKYSPKAGLIVRADPLIKEIFVNFVGNSVKYSSESVEIGIYVGGVVREDKKFYRVCVEDNGDGVPDEKKQKIFRRFERGTKKASGKGLGLHIVKMLVEKYSGEVWVEDRVRGDHTQGARFCFTIPKA